MDILALNRQAIIGLFGIFFAVVACIGCIKSMRVCTVHWKSTQGAILKFEIPYYNSAHNPPSFEVKAIYSYEVGNKRFENSKVSDENRCVMCANRISSYFGSMEPKQVTVFYDPNDLSRSLLIKPNIYIRWIMVFLLGLLAASLFIVAIKIK